MKTFALLTLALMLAACAPLTLPEPTALPDQPEPTTHTPEATTATPGALPQPTATPLSPLEITRRPPELATVPPTSVPVVGEVPPTLQENIEADLEQRIGIARTAFTYVRAEFVVWNDGSLGCPQPGMAYTQALVPGYWVVIRVGDAEYDYRASEGGSFMLCEPMRPRP
jgi:hypothetical protein